MEFQEKNAFEINRPLGFSVIVHGICRGRCASRTGVNSSKIHHLDAEGRFFIEKERELRVKEILL